MEMASTPLLSPAYVSTFTPLILSIYENLFSDLEQGSDCVSANFEILPRAIQVNGVAVTLDFFGTCDDTCSDPEIACGAQGWPTPTCNLTLKPGATTDPANSLRRTTTASALPERRRRRRHVRRTRSADCLKPNACNFNPEATEEATCISARGLRLRRKPIGCMGICGGCLADGDNDGVCDDVDPCVGAYDACGVCNGPGAIYGELREIPAGVRLRRQRLGCPGRVRRQL